MLGTQLKVVGVSTDATYDSLRKAVTPTMFDLYGAVKFDLTRSVDGIRTAADPSSPPST